MDRPTHEAVAIHTAARRYCMDAHSKWCDEYARLAARGEDRENDGYHYTPKARRTFPRYNVLAAILVAVETIEREALGSFEDTRELLIATAAADNEFIRAPQEELEFAAMQEERDAFTTFVRQLSP